MRDSRVLWRTTSRPNTRRWWRAGACDGALCGCELICASLVDLLVNRGILFNGETIAADDPLTHHLRRHAIGALTIKWSFYARKTHSTYLFSQHHQVERVLSPLRLSDSF